MTKNRIVGTALVIFGLILAILYALKNTLFLNLTINYIGIIMVLVLIMNALLVLILVSKEQKKILSSRPIGYGLTINPRNPIGVLIYILLILLALFITR